MTTSQGRRALLILNRHARNGATASAELIAALRQGGLEVQVADDDALSVGERIQRQAAGCDLIIVGGGDGTLNAATPALMAAGLPVGILPLGTANDLAKTLGIPADPLLAVQLIVNGSTRPMDVGMVNDKPFLNVASIGFSAELADGLSAQAKKTWGRFGYALAAFRLLRRMRRFTLFIEHDGQLEKVKTVQASVGNGRHYGGGMTVEQSASADDGQLDFYSLEVRHWWELLALFPRLRSGTHGSTRKVRAFQTTGIRLSTRRPMPINTDGELTTQTPAVFRIEPDALQVYRP
jgi:diacylglycerol kinase (ATP)